MDFKKLLENKTILYSAIAGVVVVFALILTLALVGASNSASTPKEKVIKEPLDLFTTDNIGKVIEVQALLAREGITVYRKMDGSKSTLYIKDYTPSQRDRVYLAIVKSGLVDQNVGLEIFDKGDFTSTKEDKRIRLARAINGELSRLIRKIPPIENASVFISIPEQTMFSSMQKPITATVQITIPSGDKLDALKVKAITNLLLGSVTGLEAENISITDTNGNVYSSIMDSGDEMVERSKENDKYMQQKINAQLDKLIGKGNFVVTVSTSLRQSPIERSSITYDPTKKTAVNEQIFREGLGDKSQGTSAAPGGAVSVSLPRSLQRGITTQGNSTSQSKSYERSATETQYGVSKTQTNEYSSVGAIEEVSVAVTLEKSALPAETTLDEIKELVANAAGPKVSIDNVTIALSDSIDPFLASDKPANLPVPNESGNPWWLLLVIGGAGLVGGLKYISHKNKIAQKQQAEELMKLEEKAQQQDEMIQNVNQKAMELYEKQNQMAQGLLEQKQQESFNVPAEFNEAVSELQSDMEDVDEEELGEKIKNWIEKA
ncbi:MAG: flagellar M-ring protein FliF [Candidatus Melainabacteria bacterium]|nr:MAG: flagellar M-ring protein FliF [Candidatus Melainabacteria bacterium]